MANAYQGQAANTAGSTAALGAQLGTLLGGNNTGTDIPDGGYNQDSPVSPNNYPTGPATPAGSVYGPGALKPL